MIACAATPTVHENAALHVPDGVRLSRTGI